MAAKIVLGLNFGDEGKGTIVDYLCSQEPVDLVVRFNGGFQAAHNVINKGLHHTFSQFGSGSFWGVPTYLSPDVIVQPEAMLSEYQHLVSLGLSPKVYVDPRALVSTCYHKQANRIIDKLDNHGSCGVGIGLTREMWAKTGIGITWGDLTRGTTALDKLRFAKQWCQDKVVEHLYRSTLKHSQDLNRRYMKMCDSIDEELQHLTSSKNECDEFSWDVLSILRKQNPNIVFEGAQGLALDEVYGTIPHTTYSDTSPQKAIDLCKFLNLEYEVIGVTRSFETRHGNGPMFLETHNGRLPEVIKEDHNYNNGSFAGKFRAGYLNHRWINEAIKEFNISTLAITWMDKVAFDFNKIEKPMSYILSTGPEASYKTFHEAKREC